MWFERGESVVSARVEYTYQILESTVTLPSRPDLSPSTHFGVFDVEVVDVLVEDCERIRIGLDADFDEVRRIERCSEVRGVHGRENVTAAFGGVAVDVLFVLVNEGYSRFFGTRGFPSHPIHHFFTVVGGVVALRDIVGEHVDVLHIEAICDLEGALEALLVSLEVVGDTDLPDG